MGKHVCARFKSTVNCIWGGRGKVENEGPENRQRETKEDLLVPLLILTFIACAWLVYTYENQNWLIAFQQVESWIAHPTIIYTSTQIVGIPLAFLATIEVLILGAACSYLLLNNEKDVGIRVLSVLGLGFGLTGLITIIFGVLGNLYQLPLNITILLLIGILLSAIVYKKKRNQNLTIKESLTPHISFPNLKAPPNIKFWLPACVAIGITFFFCFYHALLTVIVHWDAVVYHAAMANIMYNYHAIPVIAGPSIGIEMSANFPPLFSAVGAFYYIQIGTVEDFFLRIIPPVMGLLTVLATYKIGEILVGKKLGLISALFLAITPLFFRYSIYATSYSTLTFFCTASILFLLLAMNRGDTKYWISCGLFYGFALLTSYLGLYLAPFFILALILFLYQRKNTFRINIKKVSLLIVAVLVIGGVWYLRNYNEVGNPIYPNAYTILGGLHIDPIIEQATFNSIKTSATISFFGAANPSLFDKIMIFLTYRTHFPSVSFLTVLGLVLIPTLKNKKFWLITVWPLSLSFLVLSGISWGFPRHMVFAMPGFALISALPLVKLLDICKKYDSSNSKNALLKIRNPLPAIRKSNLIRLGLVIILLGAFLFPSLTLSMGGKVMADNLADQVPNDYLWFLEHPNADTWTVLDRLYPEAVAWQFMNENLGINQKAATVENRIYDVKNCNNSYFFYLDGWEARPLYNITDPKLMIQFLRSQNVKYVIDVLWPREDDDIFNLLPLTQYLGSAYFPPIIDTGGNPNIYNVGPFESPVTDNSPTTVSLNLAGWGAVQSVGGVKTQSVIAGNDSARLYVATPGLTTVAITYLDVGTDPVSINMRDPYSLDWVTGYADIQKTNTGTWKTYDFLAPYSDKGSVELALHAYDENFTVSNINASPFQSPGRVTLNAFNSTQTFDITNKTTPPTLMVYLPILDANENLIINSTTYGKAMCIELYDGVIQPGENTGWWLNHDFVTRSPDTTAYGVQNPSLFWETKNSGLYTMVIVLREPYNNQNTKMDIIVMKEDNLTRLNG